MNQRLNKLKTYLQKKKIDALLVSSVTNILYLTGFAGFSKEEREAYLFIPAQPLGSEEKNGYLLTDARYLKGVRKAVKDFEVVKVSSTNRPIRQLKRLIKKYRIKRLGFEKNNLTVKEFEDLNDLNHFIKIIPTEDLIESLRAVKKPEEILAIEKACQLGDKTFKYILKKIKSGMTERQLAFEIEFFIKKKGADIAFPPIVAFGANSSVPHHQTTHNSKLKTHNLILLDFGVRLNNYCSDMTRVVFLGKATREQRKVYEVVLEAQKKVIERLGRLTSDGGPERSRRNSSEVKLLSIKAKDIDKIVRDYIVSRGYPILPHSLGHGVGLEVHELPRLSPKIPVKGGSASGGKDILKPGMVFSIEPGIYLPRRSLGEGGFGIRIEDLVVLEKSGPRLLTKSPKKIIEV